MAKVHDHDSVADRLASIGARGAVGISDQEVLESIKLFPVFFRKLLTENGFDETAAKALTTKFRDAGRRSAPWKTFSSRVAGRPQDGQDGNRINRWLMPTDHKQYATEREATLVEISFYLQALSFDDAPRIANAAFRSNWSWATGSEIEPGNFLDPVQLRPMSLKKVAANPRMLTSGHIVPLDRGGKHELGNVFLVLHRSNQMQGNMTLSEFLQLSESIVEKHKASGTFPSGTLQGGMESVDFFDSPHG